MANLLVLRVNRNAERESSSLDGLKEKQNVKLNAKSILLKICKFNISFENLINDFSHVGLFSFLDCYSLFSK